MSKSILPYTTGSLVSGGTAIGYRQIGSGPGVILLHGGMQASQNYMRLAAGLGDAFTVYVPDRRGRGMSGPPGDHYSIATECQDVEALRAKTGAQLVFGHSSGGLIALQAALTLPSIRKVAVYEPPLAVDDSIPMAWVPRYEREMASGKLASAMITALKGLNVDPRLAALPRWLLLPLLSVMVRGEEKSVKPNDVSIKALIPTQHFDMILVKDMAGHLGTFAEMRADVCLLSGAKSPAFLGKSLDALARTLPHVQRIEYADLDHSAPNETAPERIAADLQSFFSQSAEASPYVSERIITASYAAPLESVQRRTSMPYPTPRPGFYDTTFTPGMIASLRALGEPRWAADGSAIFVLETHDGRGIMLRLPLDGGPILRLTSDPAPAPASAYAGGFYTVRNDALAFVGADGALWLMPLPRGGMARRIVTGEGRVAAPTFSPDGRQIAYVADDGKTSAIGIADAEGQEWPRHVPVEADFAADPAWSPDGKTLAWLEWSVPNMGWDESRIVTYHLETGERRVVMGEAEVSCAQPRWSPSGQTLTFLCDKGGYLNLWRAAGDGSSPAPWVEEPFEHGYPQWGSGDCTYVWSPDGKQIALSHSDDAYWKTRILAVNEATGAISATRELGPERGSFSALRWSPRGDALLAMRHGPTMPPTIVTIDVASGAQRDLYSGTVGGLTGEGAFSPESLTWKASDGLTQHGFLYRPAHAPDGQNSIPLLVLIHGGPTGQSLATWNPIAQYFIQRGWGVFVPNVRGSAGYGRAYIQALRNEWGGKDMADIVAGVEAVVARGWADGSRVVPWGGSAGGYAVLQLLATYPDRFKAGVSLFGVTDLFNLARTTHRLEAHYLDRIVGPLPEAYERYRAWSPFFHVDRFQAPVLLLQGEIDPVVTKDQATAMEEALRRAGKTVEMEIYPGEGHGWARAHTIKAYIARMERFLQDYVLLR